MMISRSQRETSAFIFLVALSILFVLNSFPFMFPGYDMWWHMGSIDASELDSSRVPGRFFWHALWGAVFGWLPGLSIFERALIVHRFQFLLSGLLVGAAGYLLLDTIFRRANMRRSELLILAWLGSVIWFLMQGTSSQAIAGGSESYALMSWISWYSINYQISLPFSLLASSALIYSVGNPLTSGRRILMLMVCIVCILITAVIHAAEVPYFLVAAIFVGGLYIRGRKGMRMILIMPLIAALFVYFALKFSDRTPEVLRLVIQGEWSVLLGRVSEYGHLLVDLGLNRSTTGWNTLTTASTLLLVLSLGIAGYLRSPVEFRPAIFVLLTGLMPLALLIDWSAGLLATVTYPEVAWRFSLASFLFLGIPIFLALIGLHSNDHSKIGRQIVASLLLGTIVYCHSAWNDRAHAVNRLAESIVNSLDQRKMYFGLSSDERSALDKMYIRLREMDLSQPLCIDVFSANYLFFLKDYRFVYVPTNLDQLPSVKFHNSSCDFPQDGGDLIRLGIPQPPWRFDLEAVTKE
jgi:hypothetical protein